MPYTNSKQLPKTIKIHLPLHAQHIYQAAFNNAYKDQIEDKNQAQEEAEVIAHKVAWSAVKKKYTKNRSGQWTYNHKHPYANTRSKPANSEL